MESSGGHNSLRGWKPMEHRQGGYLAAGGIVDCKGAAEHEAPRPLCPLCHGDALQQGP